MNKMNKILIAVLLVLMLGLSVAVWATENDLTLQMQPSVTEVGAGETFEVVVSVAENPGILQAQFELIYDPEVVQLLSVSTDNTVFQNDTVSVLTEGAGKAIIDLLPVPVEENAEAVVQTAVGQLVTVQFQVAENYEGTISMTLVTVPGSFLTANGEAGPTVMDVTCEITAIHVHKEVTVPGTQPTCTEPGLSDGVNCETCGETLQAQQPLDPTGHTEVEDPAKDPTCTEPGLTAGSHCSVCNEVITAQQPVDATGHTPGNPVRENEIYASCVADGSYEAVVYCTVCNTELSRSDRITLANGNHVFAVQTERVEPTCTKNGYIRMACGCGETKDTVLNATGHTEVTDDGVEATCTQPGLTSGSHCDVCKETLIVRQPIDAKGHTEKILNGYAATCTEHGLSDGKVCQDCGTILEAQTQTELAPHTEMPVMGFAATCTEPGLTDGVSCAVCNAVIVAQTETELAPHSEEVIPAVDATCTTPGLTEGKACAICNAIIEAQQETELAQHKGDIVHGCAPTCTGTGLTDGYACVDCGAVIVSQSEIPPMGHKEIYAEPEAPTCGNVGYTEGTRCENCGVAMSGCFEIERLPHQALVIQPAKDATCNATGLTEGQFCSACGEVIIKQLLIPTTEHNEILIEAEAPTCTSVGWTEGSRCTICNEVLVQPAEVAALPHEEVTIAGKDATCTEPGKTTGCICDVCGTVLAQQQEIPALGHVYDHDCDVSCNTCGATRLSRDHQYGNWYTVRPATEESTGEEARSCVHCGETEKRILSKLTPVESNDRKWTIIMAFVVMIGSAGGIAVALHLRRKQ